MTTFYVGQRVRKVRGEDSIGLTGTVVEIDLTDPFGLGLGVAIDSVANTTWYRDGSDAGLAQSGEIVFGDPKDFEPILSSGHQPAELSVEELLPFLKGKKVQA